MKIKHNKILTYSMLGLAAVSLVGIAFSSWLVQETQGAKVENITVSVADVQDKSLIITDAKVDENNSTFLFDAKKDDKTGPIIYTGTTGGEDLNFGITFKVEKALNADGTAAADNFGGVNVKWEVTDNTAGQALQTAITSNYIVSPLTDSDVALPSFTTIGADSGTTVSGTNVKVTYGADATTKTTLTVSVTFSFAWGSKTGGQNPGEYATTDDPATTQTALQVLKNLKAANNAKFNIVLTPFLKA